METDKALYVFQYYGRLMTIQERLAHRHLVGTAKATHGHTDAAAQSEARKGPHHLRKLLSDNSEVLQLTSEGLNAFVVRTAQRILDEHSDEIVFNLCPRCGALARTPRARQCRLCGYDWHDSKSR
jgi:hypothetical protein